MWLLENVLRLTNCDSNTPAKTLSVQSARSGEGMSFACHFNSLKSTSANPGEVKVGAHLCLMAGTAFLPMSFSKRKTFPHSISRTLYLSIGSSCCSWLSRIVWYSLSYFFSFFVGTCGTHLEDTHLKIRETPERLSESSACKQEAKEALETAAELSCSPLLPPPLLSKPCHLPIHCRLAEIFLCLLLLIFQILWDIAIRNKNKMEPENREEENMLWYEIKCLIKKKNLLKWIRRKKCECKTTGEFPGGDESNGFYCWKSINV